MITWREENLDGRIDAHLGEHRVGSVWTYGNRGEASWEVWLGKYGADGTCPTLSAAKAALAEAVGGWCERANLVHLPAGHAVVPPEVTPEMRAATWASQYRGVGGNDDEVAFLVGRRMDDPAQAEQDAQAYRDMIAARPHPSREELT